MRGNPGRGALATCSAECGLSPRVRGNRPRESVRSSPRVRGNHRITHRVGRSIPARAGEPSCTRSIVCTIGGPVRNPTMRLGVYPRACGGTGWRLWLRRMMTAVYPRACGGTAPRLPARPATPRVYPRACGGTYTIVSRESDPTAGLSPRVRGNRISAGAPTGRRNRSIPARAGEPAIAGNPLCRMVMGLSPRVRGNRFLRLRPPLRWGSIPARAGEPSTG